MSLEPQVAPGLQAHLLDDAGTLAEGRQLNGYRLLRQLGEGGGGRVYLADQVSTGQLVALKLLRDPNPATPDDGAARIARFEREIGLCARLHHPHIVRLLDKGYGANGQLYAVFEYVPGETLKDLLIRKGALSAVETGQLLGQVLDALACAHAQGIVHRDLKPHNIMVTSTGTRSHVKVLDFGIAALVAEPYRNELRAATVAEGMMCSPSYSAPEQLRGEPPSVKTDLYAWGLVCIECLTGKPAIDGMTLAEVYHKQLSALEVLLPAALSGHPLADLLRRVLRKAPSERAERADALLLDFQCINLATVHADLRQQAPAAHQSETTPDAIATMPYQAGWSSLAYERRQITVLCCSLVLAVEEAPAIEIEALEAVQRDQLSQCVDIAARFGGHLAGSLGSSLMFYFGYPRASDDDARRCARAALELVGQMRRRRPMLAQQHGIGLDVSIGIHTGMVLVTQGYVPSGVTPNTAQQLERLARAGTVLISASARRMLDQYLEFNESRRRVLTSHGVALPYFELTGEQQAEALSWQRMGTQPHAMVGREGELAVLQLALTSAGQQTGGSALVAGQAGIGKSRLLHEISAVAQHQGHVLKHCRCLPEHRSDALYPFLQLLRAHLHLPAEGVAAAALARLRDALVQAGNEHEASLPILCSWLALPTGSDSPSVQLSPDRQRHLMLATMTSLILQMGQRQPLLLVIEDIHWIDQTSAELLARLSQAAPQHALLLLMTSRDAAAIPAGFGPLEQINLERLDRPHAEQLIATLIGPRTLTADALRRLCERTDGVPLFIEELICMLLDQQLLKERDGKYALDPRFDSGDVPVTLRDLLGARLARLGPARATAQLGATIGREFDYALLVEVALTDEASVQADLEQLIDADLIYRQRRVQGDSYVFRHALFLDAAYDALPSPVRAQTHARIARQLSAASPEQVERHLPQLARHFSLAAEFGPAVQFGMRAVLAALQRALYDDAAHMAQQVDGWIGNMPPVERQDAEIDNCAMLTQALMALHGWGNARVKENVDRSLRLIGESGDARRTVPALWTMAIYHHVAGNRKQVRGLSERLMDLSARAQDPGLSVACHTMLGVSSWIDGAYPRAAAAFDVALEQYDALAHADHGNVLGVDSRIWSMAALANVRWFIDADGREALALASAAVDCAETLNHIPSLGVALMYQAFVHQYADDRAATGEVCGRLLRLADKYGLPAVEGYAALLRCWATRDLSGADQVCTNLQGLGCMLGATYTGALVAEIAAGKGDYASAVARLDDCLALSERLGEQYFKPELLLRRAAFRSGLAGADRDQVEQDLLAAAATAQAYGMDRSARRAGDALARLHA